jgi:tRNA dimethylallyltransferase
MASLLQSRGMIQALCIMGPTASGKSALALALAARLGADIVNADSMQVYADLRILTARPSQAEEAAAPHHLYGCIDAAERFSVGGWIGAVRPVLAEIAARGRLAILVGGTGLYFKALTEGLAATPPIPQDVRAELGQRLLRDGAPGLHGDLAMRDPKAAALLSPNDAPRILRALEVFEATGESILVWRDRNDPPVLAAGAWAGVALTPPRADLYARIDARFAAMLEAGVLEEVAALAARKLDPLLPCMKAHGVPALMAHLRGEMGLPGAAKLAAQDTRNYAKRQFTWMRGQMPDWPQITADDEAARIGAVLAHAGLA